MQVWSLGQNDPLEEGMATHSSILAWRIPMHAEPGRLQSIGLQRVWHDWGDSAQHTAQACIFPRFFPLPFPPDFQKLIQFYFEPLPMALSSKWKFMESRDVKAHIIGLLSLTNGDTQRHTQRCPYLYSVRYLIHQAFTKSAFGAGPCVGHWWCKSEENIIPALKKYIIDGGNG